MTQLTPAERVRRAMAGGPLDRPPISFWAHNFARENSAEELAAETVRVYHKYNWDFIKMKYSVATFFGQKITGSRS